MTVHKDDFMSAVSDMLEENFPKGVAEERGEAMVLVADILRFLIKEGVVEVDDE
jgi:hypothetical protein